MTLKVLSCAPRAFEIRNFLSDAETDHILNLAGVLNLSRSKTGDAVNTKDDSETRTSFNTWVTREQDYGTLFQTFVYYSVRSMYSVGK